MFPELNESFAALGACDRWLPVCLARGTHKREPTPLTLLSGNARRSLCQLFRPRKSNDMQIERDPEKWTPVFRKDHAPAKSAGVPRKDKIA
jgi:hypothetical protein